MSLIWTISGAGRAVGKTTVARSIAASLDNSVYCKCGHNPPKPEKPANFFQGLDELNDFVDRSKAGYDHIVIESNKFVYTNSSDITIYIDGVKGKTNFREDAPRLRSAADIIVTPESLPSQWQTFLTSKLTDDKYVPVVTKILLNQQQWLFLGDQ